MDDFLKKVDEILSSAEAKKKAEEKETEEIKNLFNVLCQKTKEGGVSLIVKTKEDAIKITSKGEIFLTNRKKDPAGKWQWEKSFPMEEAKICLPNRWTRFHTILSSALKNEADVEIE